MQGLYGIKPGFQRSLVRVEDWLVDRRVHPDRLTLAAVGLAAAGGLALLAAPGRPLLLLVVPVATVGRLALNALDGLVARRLGLARPWGEALNEVCDRLADLLLLGAIGLIPGVDGLLAAAALVTTLLSSYVGLAGKAAGGRRHYEGGMGKADRMALLALAAPVALAFGVAPVLTGYLWLVLLGAAATLAQRLRGMRAELD